MDPHHDEIYLTDAQREARAEVALQEALDRDAWVWLMDSPHGRRIARQMLQVSGMLDSGFSGDLFAAGYREGQRSTGAWLLQSVKRHAPDTYTTLFEDEQ